MTPTIDRQELDELKARVDLLALVEASGLELKRVGKNWFCRCPFHEDREASLSVNPESRLWNCFGCEAGGDCFRWCQLRERLEFPQAVEFVRRFATLSAPEPRARQDVPERSALLTRVMERYVRSFKESSQAQGYLTQRGLSSRELWETFRVGYVDGSLLKSLPGSGPVREQLTTLGILRANGQEHFHGCVVVPLEHPDEGLVGFYGRRLAADAKIPHLYLPGPKRGVLQWQALKRGGRVYLAESVLDALSLWQAGVRDVSCVYGAGHLHDDLEVLLGRLGAQEVVFALDGDQAGLTGVQKMSERLTRRGLSCSWTPLPEGKDPSQLLQERGADGLRECLARPRPLLVTSEPSTQAQEAQEVCEDGFALSCDEIRYRVTLIPPFVGRLRALLVAARDSQVYSEKLDLHSQRARALNASQLVRAFEISRAEAERHLSLVLKAALEWVDSQKTEGSSLRKKAPVLNEAETSEGLAFLKRPDLVQKLLQDCEALGFVGEEKAKLLGYLIGLSRKLPKPLSGIVVSQSGAGKSSLTELVEQLTPPEDVLLYSRLTPQALYYMTHDLKGLLLILEERAGGESADYSIRTLQSRQKLRLAAPIKDPLTGKMTTQCYEVEGPVAYLETTTNPYLNPENSSRCFELFMDESEEQTRRIQARQRRQRLFSEEDLDEVCERIRQKHHNAQRLLKPLKVFIPYAERIDFPSQWLRTRRDNERFLCLIEVIAFLHQYQREQGETAGGKPYVLANLEDYRLAYELAQELFASTLHELTRDARGLFERVVQWVRQREPKAPLEVVFGFKELRPVTNYANHRLRRSMAELVEMEYVLQTQSQNGLPAQFRLLSTDLSHSGVRLVGLTTPEELRDRLAGDEPFQP